jgi:Protein of unknown function (DUF1439)
MIKIISNVVERKVKLLFSLLMIFALSGCTSPALGYTIEITQKELQERLTSLMPLNQKRLFLTGTLSSPILELKSDASQLCFVADIAVTTTLNLKVNGSTRLCGLLLYRSEEGSFYLNDIQLLELTINNLPDSLVPASKELASAIAVNAFKKTPIYTFREDSVKGRIAKSLFKSVEIKATSLVIKFELF